MSSFTFAKVEAELVTTSCQNDLRVDVCLSIIDLLADKFWKLSKMAMVDVLNQVDCGFQSVRSAVTGRHSHEGYQYYVGPHDTVGGVEVEGIDDQRALQTLPLTDEDVSREDGSCLTKR